jgi:hypothetical protein
VGFAGELNVGISRKWRKTKKSNRGITKKKKDRPIEARKIIDLQ